MADDDINLGVEADLDEAEARRSAERLAGIFEQAFASAAPRIGSELGRSIGRSLNRSLSGNSFDPFVRGAEEALDRGRELLRNADRAGEAFERMGEAGRRATRRIDLDGLNSDLDALRQRVEASRSTLQDLGARPDLFAVIDRELDRVLRRQREFNDDIETISRDPSLFEGYQESFRQSRRVISSELDAALRLLINFKEDQRQVATQLQRQEDNAARERVANVRRASSEFVVTEQGLNAQRLAETRIAGQRLIQSERIAARTRIELVRFTFRQIQILERGIAAVFRAAGNVALSAARTTQAAIARMGNLFRRSNRDLNDGLNGALLARERTLDRSFRRQTADIQASITRQSALLDRFERQASTGIVGAATGRSRIGSIFGIGAGVGGGFLLARQLREGFQETVNLNEALNKTRQIFGDASASIEAFSESSVEALFLTRSEALAAAANFGVFGKQAGLQGRELAVFAETLTRLGTDLASFNNTSVDDAVRALGSALRGESEPISRFGVDTRQAALQQRALQIGLIETNRVLTGSERTLAAYAQILAKTTDQQGDAARTADDFANSAKRAGSALTTAFAAAIRPLIPVAEFVTNTALPALTALTRFIEGDLSPALLVLRDALVGAGIALAALLGARVAVEVIQFLGIALRGAVTPLGLLVVGVAAAGAAIRVFGERSERFRRVLAGITALLRTVVDQGLTLAARGFDALASIMESSVLPAFLEFIDLIDGPVIRGLEIAIGFVVAVAIPAFARLGALIGENFVPALRIVGDLLEGTVVPGLQRFASIAVATLGAVVRFLDPAITGFVRLAEAIADAFRTGDLGGLLGGIQALAVGIGTVFANLGVLLFEALRPQVERAVRFISTAFDRIDLAAIGLRILEVVRLVGFVLGSIVSDPRFIQAVEAIAVAAVAVGAKFIQGFVQGVISNLPDLARLLGGQLTFLLEEAVDFALSNPGTVAAVVFAALAARSILNAFRTAGERGGGEMARGFISGFVPAVRRVADRDRGFFAGFFGSNTAIEREAERAAARATRAFQRRIDRANRDINRLGGVGLIPIRVNEIGARSVERRLEAVKGRFSEVGAEAILTGARTREAFRGAGAVAGGFATVLRGDVRNGFRLAAAGAQTFGRAVTDQFRSLQAQGRISGAGLGNAVLAGFGAVIAGQQLGQGGTVIGLAGILSAALAAGLAASSGTVGAAVGVIGVATAAITRSGEEAKLAAERVRGYVSAFEGLSSGEVVAAASRQITDALASQGEGIRNLLRDADFTTAGLTQAAIAGSASLETVAQDIGRELGLTSEEIQFLVENFDALERRLSDGGGLTGSLARSLESIGIGDSVSDDVDQFISRLNDAEVDVASFVGALGTIFDETGAIQEALDQLDFKLGVNNVEVDPDLGRRAAEQFEQIIDGVSFDEAGREVDSFAARARDSIADFAGFASDALGLLDVDIADAFRFDLRGTLARYIGDFTDFGVDVEDVNERIRESVERTNDAFVFEDFLAGLGGITDTAQEAAASVDLIGEAVRDLNERRTAGIRSQIEAVRRDLDGARDAADRARESLTSFLTSRYADTARAQVDRLIGQVGSIGSEIEEALLQGGVRGEARLRSAVGGFEQQLASIIQAGFEDGLRTQDEFRALLAPLLAAIDEEVGDSASRILSTTDFEFGITDRAGSSLRDALTRALADRQVEVGVRSIINAEAEVRRLEDALNAQEAQLEVDVVFDAAQIQAALAAAGASAEQLAAINPTAVTNAQQTGLAGTVANANRAATGVPTTNVEVTQNNDTTIEVRGSDGPRATAIEVARQQRAQAAGQAVDVGGLIGVRIGSGVAF